MAKPITVHFYDTIVKDRWVEKFDGYYSEEDGFIHSWFSSGNYSCDHNRCLRSPDGRYYEGCNTGIIKIEKIVADDRPDVILYSETEPDTKRVAG